jgi:hypothetical protein
VFVLLLLPLVDASSGFCIRRDVIREPFVELFVFYDAFGIRGAQSGLSKRFEADGAVCTLNGAEVALLLGDLFSTVALTCTCRLHESIDFALSVSLLRHP